MSRPRKPSPLATRDDVARHFGVSVRTVATWLREGMPGEPGAPGQADGKFDAAAIDAWLKARGGAAVAAANPHRNRQDDARAGLLELELARERGELLPAAEFLRRAVRKIHESKGLLGQLPSRINRLLPGKTPADVRARLRQQIERMLESVYLALEEGFAIEADAIEAEAAGPACND